MRSPRTLPQRIDRCVHSTKWIAAGLATLFFPLILHAVGLRIRQLATYPVYSTMFLAGAAIVIAMSRTKYAKAPWVLSAITLERRWTQGLISRLLLAPHKNWLGRGNWIILASPFFIPIASILVWLLSWLFFPPSLRSFALGLGVSYHIASVITQWRLGTKESRRLGVRFAIFFLVPANLFVIGAAYGFALNGFAGIFQFVADVMKPLFQGFQLHTQIPS